MFWLNKVLFFVIFIIICCIRTCVRRILYNTFSAVWNYTFEMDKLIFKTNVIGFIFGIVCTIFVCFFLFAFCENVPTIFIVTVYTVCLFNRINECSCCIFVRKIIRILVIWTFVVPFMVFIIRFFIFNELPFSSCNSWYFFVTITCCIFYFSMF